MNMKKYITRLLISTSATACIITPAFAQNSGPILDEIIVTSQYRKKGLQDVPISVAAVGAKVIKETNIVKIEDLATVVPNFSYSETGLATTFLIRGIGSGVNQGFEQSVGVYVDGVHYPRGQQVRMPFLDLERVEVLRGPQSILFGKNSVAGAMNITTAKPSDTFEGNLYGSYEFEDGEKIVEGMLTGPLSDRVRARVAARYRDADGFIANATLNRDEAQREEFTVRGMLEMDVTDNLIATAKVEMSNFDVFGRNIEIENALPNIAFPVGHPLAGLTYPEILVGAFGQHPSTLNAVQDGIRSSNGDESLNELRTYQLDLDWQLGDFKLKSISAYQTMGYTEVCDCDFTGAEVFHADSIEDYNQFSQELRLTSPEGDRFSYILGAFAQWSNHDFQDQIVVENNSVLVPAINGQSPGAGNLVAGTRAGRVAAVDATVLSAFAAVDWKLQDNLTLQLGGRVTNDNKDGSIVKSISALDGGALPAAQAGAALVYANLFGITSTNLEDLAGLGVPGAGPLFAALGDAQLGNGANGPVNRKKTTFSPDIKLAWDVNDDTLLYASWAKGNKSGGFDFRANNRFVSPTALDAFVFDDENATNYELGGKFKLGGSAELNATAYFTEFSDLQISIFDGSLGFNVGNAGAAEVKGIEVDGRWAVTDHVRLNGGFAITDFEFTEFENGQCYFGQTPNTDIDGDGTNELCDYAGLAANLVSDFSGNFTMDFDMPVMADYEVTGMVNLFYASAYDSAPTHDPAGRQDGFAKINARLAFAPQDGPWEIAILGKNLTDEIVRTFNGDAPLAGNTFGAKTNFTFYSQGRTIAVQGSLKF